MAEPKLAAASAPATKRLASLDAYRGLVMLAMASSGFAFAEVVRNNYAEVMGEFRGTFFDGAWQAIWHGLSYEFSHVAWTGCTFWDLIQPSFMFMVGVSMPFSYSKREAMGQSWLRRFWHAIVRSLILILLAIFLMSNWRKQTHFDFVNVLAQIGLGYTFVYLLWRRHLVLQLLAAAAILGGYWYFFYQYTIPESEYQQVRTYLVEELELNPREELNQFTGIAAHWNKHTNAAAAVDRRFLSRYPREAEPWQGRTFWVNRGGYQTLNFVPSIVTMLFGVMAGRLIRGDGSDKRKMLCLFSAGLICFATSMAVDTTIWPVQVAGWDWSLCPIVKRIWTPSWTLFSAGWTFWMMAALYWVIDVRGRKAWAFPLVVVGMNSIAMYCMAQLLKPWISKVLQIHLRAVDQILDPLTLRFFDLHTTTVEALFGSDYAYAPLWESLARLFVLWLICLWLYRRKIFIRI